MPKPAVLHQHYSAWTLRGSACLIAMLMTLAAATVNIATPLAVGQAAASSDRVVIAQPPKAINDFELVDQEGHPFKFSQLRNQPALVFFGFTHCPDVCPATLARLRALTDTRDHELRNVQVVMISVDGDRDSPATMKAYLAQISPRFMGLTGDPRKVREIAAQFPAVFFKGLPDKPGGAYGVEHTSQVCLIDRQGRLRASFYDAPVEAMEQVLRSVAE